MKRSRTAGLAAGLVLAATSLTFVGADEASAQGTAPCPSYYYCFYENSSYNRYVSGWHLNYYSTTSGSFSNPPSSSGDRHDELTSIINNGNRTICIYNNGFFDDTLIKRVAPYQDVSYIGDSANDKADRWKVFSGNSACPSD
ncbi:peptidase inhibitor family I36 protein [Luteipulveratus halotolerans]|uniref:Peptidase inhibitor family I36 n=1 Tax=Luteipulveratus halotolerans TaxID=1631356 RepID=A0A0L6CEM6_9MICO|nr:peptidase inhibitor family I36 protein [Luteipulveratus halotolerans]KNX36020.1 hypothetical protein VV01_00790 [Luteipulveratus halotolerans]